MITLLVDDGEVLEIQPAYGRSMNTSLARIGGQPVAIVANQPAVKAGSIDGPAADKAARFIELVDAFHLPVVFLADNPGVLAGSVAETSGILRRAARLFAAQHRITSPKVHITLRKAYGFGSSVMAMNPFDHQTLTVAFPGARLGAMPAEGAGRAAGANDDTKVQLDAAERAGGWSTADSMGYDEIIDPRDLRNVVLVALRTAARASDGAGRTGDEDGHPPLTPVSPRVKRWPRRIGGSTCAR